MASAASNPGNRPEIDSQRRFVRKLGERANGFVEFEFAIGEPEIFVELILPREDFAEFCTGHQVEMLPAHGADGLPPSDWDWRLSDATGTRFK
jgi:phenol/toluene 2-monooxygenase (NADH) P0/A0